MKWWLRGPAVWNYGNLQQKYVDEEIDAWYGTYSYGIRPMIKVESSSKYLSDENTTGKFEIKPTNIEKMTLANSKYSYSGSVKTPGVTVKDSSGKILVKDKDYTVSYASGRKNVGTYKVTAKGKGGYTGTVTKTFKINPKGATISTPKKAEKAFTAKWSKQSEKMSKNRITGYQVRYSLKKDFSSGVKTKSVKGYQKTSVKISKLKAKKTYYVQVRTYMDVDGKTYYSPWSKTKSVKTK